MDRSHQNDTWRHHDGAAEIDAVGPGRSPATARLTRTGAREDDLLDRAAGGSGAPLPAEVRNRFESSLQSDLGEVRVHTGTEAAAAAGAIQARAYTVGQDIYFNRGQYDPTGSAGLHLLAHEVAHTVQQGGGAGLQQKSELSVAGDAHEVEADRAADAMLSGSPVTVSPATGLARRIQRDELPEIAITAEPESLRDSVGRGVAAQQQADDGKYSWGGASLQTTDAGGNPIENDQNPVVANARRNGSIGRLRQLSSELDLVKLPLVAWKSAMAAVTAVQGQTGIDPESPGSYAADFKRMKTDLGKGAGTGMTNVINELKAAQAARQKTALLELKEAQSGLRAAQAAMEGHQILLQGLKARAELKDNAEARAAIDEKIAQCVKIITGAGKVIVMIASGIGSLEALGMSSGAVALKAEGAGQAISISGKEVLPKTFVKGAEVEAGAGDALTWVFQNTLFAAELDACKAAERELNRKIASLDQAGITLQGVDVASKLGAAVEKANAAKQNKEDADREFRQALQSAGQNYDQRHMDAQEIDAGTPEAKSHHDGETTMEGLMVMYMSMTARRQSREAFLVAAGSCSTLNLATATKIVQDVMDAGKMARDPGGLAAAGTTIDNPENAGASGVDHLVAGLVGDQLRQGVAMALSHIEVARNNDAAQKRIEAQWEALVAMGTAGKIAGQM